MKRRQKAGFLSLISSKITLAKGKERRKRKSEEKERRRREKSDGCALSFYNGYLHNVYITFTYITITFSKLRLDIYLFFENWATNTCQFFVSLHADTPVSVQQDDAQLDTNHPQSEGNTEL